MAMDVAATQVGPERLERLRAGDATEIDRIVREYSPRMLAVARKFLGSEHEAQDALQDAWISALRALPSFQGEAMLSTWLHRIVVNASLMRLRSAKRGVRGQERPIDDLLPSFGWLGHHRQTPKDWTPASESLEVEERRALVRKCIDELPESFRTVLLLRDIEELDTDATAKLLGLSTGATKAKLHRARQALRTLLEQAISKEARGAGGRA
jgi:RNA polymerase sigma-70 factor, ECF subfamily